MVAVLNSPHARDVASVIHPFTNLVKHEQEGPLILEEGKGIFVRDLEGNEYIEGLAGLWCTALGFGNERLIAAATAQMRKLPYYHAFFHRSTMPAIELAERLLALAPVPMSKVWFANSGSEANDHMMKFVWYYNNALGRPEKKKIIARLNGYHGIAISSGSLTGMPLMHAGFDLPIRNVVHTDGHHHYRDAHEGESEEAFATRRAQELEQLILDEGPESVAAFVAEPVMGAGGAIVPPATYFEKMQAVCRRHDVLIVSDEVITGFHRTGNTFGCETYGFEPDVIVVAKQLSSAYLPISAVMMNEKMYGPIRDFSATNQVLGTGFTYGGPPRVRRGRGGDTEDLRGDRHRRPRRARRPPLPGTAERARRPPPGGGGEGRRPHGRGGAGEGQGHEGELRAGGRHLVQRRLHPPRCAAPGLRGQAHRPVPAPHHRERGARHALRPPGAGSRRHPRTRARGRPDVAPGSMRDETRRRR